MSKCTYKTVETSGTECNCPSCIKIQEMLMEKESKEEINIIDPNTD